MISMPLQSRSLCSMERAKLMVALAYCITPILCLPIYFTFSVQTIRVNHTQNIPSIIPLHSGRRFTTEMTTVLPKISRLITTLNKTKISSPVFQRVKYVVNLSNLSNQHPNLVKMNFWIYRYLKQIQFCEIFFLTIHLF